MKPWMMALLGSVALQVLPTHVAAQTAPATPAAGADWPTYGHDKGGMRYSPLTQITPADVAELKPAWVFHMRPPAADASASAEGREAAQQAVAEGVRPQAAGGRRFAASQATPLVVGGRMYLTTPYGRVVALQPETGEELWSYAVAGPGQPTQRGAEYWPGDAETPARVIFGTRDGRLIALDAATGRPAEGFGVDGVVNLKTPEIMNGVDSASYGMTSPPLVYGDLIITGAAVQEGGGPGASGDVRAWDVRTGALVWTLHSIDQETGGWSAGSAQARSGVNAWGFMTVDEARGVVYIPLGAPAWDRYGGDREGANLFSTSLVAADAKTGRYLWHFQVVHHDIWDFDLASPPTLFDVVKDGRTIPAVGIVGKVGYMFILDRTTGEPIYPVTETPVPASDVPGEVAAPTQPIPSRPEPLARTTLSREDLSTLTPEHEAFCKALVEDNDIRLGGPYLPTGLDRLTVNMPGTLGGTNWGGGAFDPQQGLYIVNTFDLGQIQSLSPADGGTYSNRSPLFGRFWQPETRMPCTQPPWGQLVAVDVNTGDIAWRSTLGVTDTLPEAIQATGRPSIGGPIVTAGGLVFIGATDDARFRAFDSHSGRELWSVKLDASAHATPMTFMGRDGKQYVVVTSAGGSFLGSPVTSDAVTAYALP